MTERTSLLNHVSNAMRDHGIAAALTALVGGAIALLASVTRKAFTNDAMLARLGTELSAEQDSVARRHAEDREADADRLARIETDIRAMRDLMFDAFQRGRTDCPFARYPNLPRPAYLAVFFCLAPGERSRLMPTDTRDPIRLIQNGLDELGHSPGALDGFWGP